MDIFLDFRMITVYASPYKSLIHLSSFIRVTFDHALLHIAPREGTLDEGSRTGRVILRAEKTMRKMTKRRIIMHNKLSGETSEGWSAQEKV